MLPRCNLDPFSFAAHARLKVLLLPLQPIKKARFDELVALFVSKNVVRFDDIPSASEVTATDPNLLNTKTLPSGRLLIEYTLARDNDHDYLHSLELSRRTYAVILIGDATEKLNASTIDNACKRAAKETPTALLVKSFIFCDDAASDLNLGNAAFLIRASAGNATHLSSQFRDQLFEFCSQLFKVCKQFYLDHRDNTILQSPHDLASDLVRPKPQRVSSFALSDAHVPPSTPSPGPDRGSRFGLGSSSANAIERVKVQGQGRTMKFLGDLLLVCGFTADALRHYTEAATVSRGSNDYLWQASAMEAIAFCVIILECYDVPYTMPQIASTTAIPLVGKNDEAKQSVDLVDWIPTLYSTILNLYNKSTSTLNDQVPPVVMAEAALRVSKFLATVHLAGGVTKDVLTKASTGQKLLVTAKRKASYPPRAEIAAWAMRAYSETLDCLSLADKLHIYSGLAAVLGMVGFHRRRALFLREIVLSLVPALVQARVTDAAGKGIHPAASLALGGGGIEHNAVMKQTETSISSLSSLIDDLCFAYGIPKPGDSLALQQCILGAYGWPVIRNQVLRDCSTLSEATSDFELFLKFSTLHLELNAAAMSRDDQVRLVSTIPRVLGTAKRHGQRELDVSYWDSWLLRGIELRTLADLPQKRVLQDLLDTEQSKSPFLYDAFAKRASSSKEVVAVQSEPFTAICTLQNPFEFDIEIPDMTVVIEGVSCDSDRVSTFVKAQSTMKVPILCTPSASGLIVVKGCKILVTGCKSGFFPIRNEPTREDLNRWYLDRGGANKTKRFGLDARWPRKTMEDGEAFTELSKLSEVKVEVLPAMPLLKQQTRKELTLSVSLLDGETSSLRFSVFNSSPVPVTSLTMAFTDSTVQLIQQAINARTKQPHEIYELELLLYRQTLQAQDHVTRIEGLQAAEISVDVHGKRGFTSGEITIIYGNIPEADPPVDLWTRKLLVPVRATITPSIDVVHCDLLALDTSDSILQLLSSSNNERIAKLFKFIQTESDDYCILLIDIRNLHSSILTGHISIDQGTKFQESAKLAPGQQFRALLPVRRVHLPQHEQNALIPSLSKRQFVVNQHAGDALQRTIFWYREQLLSALHASWSMGERTGAIETRTITLNRRMLNVLKKEDVELIVSTTEAKVDEMFTVDVRFKSRIGVVVGTCTLNFTTEYAEDVVDQIIVCGRPSTTINAEETTLQYQACALVKGTYKVSVEFTRDDGTLYASKAVSLVI